MKSIFIMTAAVVLCVGTAAALSYSSRETTRLNDDRVRFATDGAFRDGLYVGKLDADSGRSQHSHFARWSTARDRNSFLAGYQLGYSDVLAETLASSANRKN